MSIKAIMFDLDGTLVNSLDDLADSVNFGLKKCGFPERKTEEFNLFIGDGVYKMIERALPNQRNEFENVLRVKEYWSQYYSEHFCDKTKAYEGVPELIEKLKGRGYKLAVVTNKVHRMAEIIVKKLFGDSFDVVLGQIDGTPVKPDSAMPKKAAEKMGIAASECLFVGDSGVDIKTAINFGAEPVGVLWGFRTKEELEKNGAKTFASYANELEKIILSK